MLKFALRSLPGAQRPLPVRLPYAEAAPDPNESVGYSAVRRDIVAAPTGCHDCALKSDVCNRCELSGMSEEERLSVIETLVEMTPALRRSRMVVELQISRMKL